MSFHYFTSGCATRSKHTWHTELYTMIYKCAKVPDKQHLQCQHSLEFNGVPSYCTDEAKHLDMTLLHSNVQYRHIAVYRAFACDVSQRRMSSDFWCCAGVQVSVLHDAPVIAHQTSIMADGLTSQVHSISLPTTCCM